MEKLIIANWKCNPVSQKKAQGILLALKKGSRGVKNELVICPPFVYLPLAKKLLGKSFNLGSQDVFLEKEGAFTGEVSAAMLKDIGVKYVICGHSERRHTLGESDETINKKLRAVLKAGLRPILCVGESQEQKNKGQTFQIVEKQLKEGLKGVAKNNLAKVVIAYEPVWAIGAKNPCSVDQALTITLFIRKFVSQMAGRQQASGLKILYGGSVNSKNAGGYLASQWISGLLVGGASLEAKEFLAIAKVV